MPYLYPLVVVSIVHGGMKGWMSVGTHGSRDTSRWYLLTERDTEQHRGRHTAESREIQDERGEPAAAAAASE